MARTFKNRVEDLYGEMTKAQGLVQDILGSLQECMSQPDNIVNLTTRVGVYAVYLRENEELSFKILAQEKQTCLDAIRQVCTGEWSVFQAVEFFTKAKNQLDEALECFNFDWE